MREYPIEGLMNTVMSNLREMIDVNTVIGETIELENGTVIVPISKVSFGFAAGGSEFNMGTLEQTKKQGIDEESNYQLPFGGGSGAGVNIQPMGFLVITENSAKMLPVNHCSAIDKLLDYVPEVIDKISDVCGKGKTYTYQFYEGKDGYEYKKNVEQTNVEKTEENNSSEMESD